MRRSYFFAWCVPFVLSAAYFAGCSASSEETRAFPIGGGSHSDASVGGAAGSSTGGAGGAAEGGAAGSATGGDGGSSAGGVGGDGGPGGKDAQDTDVDLSYDAPAYEAPEACATAAVEAKLKPLDLYLMVDRSGSMSNSSKWSNQAVALNSFFNDPQSAGISVAMKFFPYDDNCGGDPSCGGGNYRNPLVGWGTLNAHAGALTNAINSTGPTGCFTPTQDAMNGVIQGARDRQNAQPDHVVAAVFVTDGTPCCGDCPVEASGGIGNIAAAGFNGTPSIRTFAIYVESVATDVMTAIAANGGTGQPFDATAGAQAFINALKTIQGSAIPCDFDMPNPSQGSVDLSQVALVYTKGAGVSVTIPHVADAGACSGDGWYFDNNTAPTKIILCGSTCTTMKADSKAKVSIELGCLGS